VDDFFVIVEDGQKEPIPVEHSDVLGAPRIILRVVRHLFDDLQSPVGKEGSKSLALYNIPRRLNLIWRRCHGQPRSTELRLLNHARDLVLEQRKVLAILPERNVWADSCRGLSRSGLGQTLDCHIGVPGRQRHVHRKYSAAARTTSASADTMNVGSFDGRQFSVTLRRTAAVARACLANSSYGCMVLSSQNLGGLVFAVVSLDVCVSAPRPSTWGRACRGWLNASRMVIARDFGSTVILIFATATQMTVSVGTRQKAVRFS